jgi:hypothetical protein
VSEEKNSSLAAEKKSIQARLRPRERRLCSSSEALASLFARLGGGEVSKLVSLWKNWTAVLGDDLACLGRPLGHKDRTLHIGADDSMALQELSMRAPDILERVNAYLRSEHFADVKVLLMQGGRDLEAPGPKAPEPAAPPQAPLPTLGGLLGKLTPGSPVTRCYEAFVALSRKEPPAK